MEQVAVVAFLIVHGFVHAAVWATPKPAANPPPFDPAHSWALTATHVAPASMRSASVALAWLAAFLFAAAGVALAVDAALCLLPLRDHRLRAPALNAEAKVAPRRCAITGALAAEDPRGVDFTLCEEFTSPPDDLRRDGEAKIGFFVRVANGRVEVGDHPIDDADFKVVSTYEDALSIARDPDPPAAQQSVMEQRLAEGTLQIVGNPSEVPATLAELDIHRLPSSRTL